MDYFAKKNNRFTDRIRITPLYLSQNFWNSKSQKIRDFLLCLHKTGKRQKFSWLPSVFQNAFLYLGRSVQNLIFCGRPVTQPLLPFLFYNQKNVLTDGDNTRLEMELNEPFEEIISHRANTLIHKCFKSNSFQLFTIKESYHDSSRRCKQTRKMFCQQLQNFECSGQIIPVNRELRGRDGLT